MKKDDAVMFDFILHKMLKINERIIYADRKMIYLAPFEENVQEYVIITIDDTGTVRSMPKNVNRLKSGYR